MVETFLLSNFPPLPDEDGDMRQVVGGGAGGVDHHGLVCHLVICQAYQSFRLRFLVSNHDTNNMLS